MKIKDVIHGEIEVKDRIIIKLIHTYEFQRLRKIKQLGVTNFHFPGAEHTRYAHSLGVYHISTLILEKFKKEESKFFNSYEELALKIAALLHDLGHGALSHTFEGFFNTKHEKFTIKMIENPNGEIYKILKEYENEKGYNLLSDVVAFIDKKHSNKALESIISSSIDADRMDYLLRDSYHSGAVYGNIDIERIISYMIYKDGHIIFSDRGIHTLENFILARYHMFVQIYLNDKSLIYEKLIQKILQHVFLLEQKGYDFKTDISMLQKLKKENIKIEDYINTNDYNFLSIITNLYEEEDEYLKKLIYYLERKPIFYEQISKKEYENSDEKDVFKTNSINKKAYLKKEPISILKKNNVVNIEEVSQIFEFCIEKLTVKIDEKYYRIKELNEI